MSSTTEVQKATTQEESEEITQYFDTVELKNDLYWWVRKEPVYRCVRRGDRTALYVKRDGDICGVSLVWSKSRVLAPNEACVRSIVVSRSQRGEGYGHRLLRESESFAESRGKSVMKADVVAESSSTSWWKRQGYEPVKQRYTDGGREMIVFKKQLDPDWVIQDPLNA
jgi:GNAT superfamily N-acetyltransferase